jgi:hypothetical protein
MLANRWVPGTAPDAPIFPDTNGGFRDPHNAQKAIRNARRPIGSQRRRELGALLRGHRRNADLTQTDTVAKLGWRRRNPEAAEHLEGRAPPPARSRSERPPEPTTLVLVWQPLPIENLPFGRIPKLLTEGAKRRQLMRCPAQNLEWGPAWEISDHLSPPGRRAGEGTRTPNPRFTRAVRCQLRHTGGCADT